MLDARLLRHSLDEVATALARRGTVLDTEAIRELEARRKAVQVEVQSLRALRRVKSREVGRCKAADGVVPAALLQEGADLGKKLQDCEHTLQTIQLALHDIQQTLPNIPHISVPAGVDEADNQVVRVWGKPPEPDFKQLDHVALGERLGLLDFESAGRIARSRFVVMKGGIARLHRALIQFMLDTHTYEHGYCEMNVPYLVNAKSCFGTGQLPKFEADLFHIREHGLYLIPTAEIPVSNLAADRIWAEEELPWKVVCHTPCFRSEAGSYGKDTRGMIRQHQFEKVELVQLVKPEDSYAVLEALTAHAEVILQRLGLAYRVVALCAGDLGFSSAKTYDLEVWLPGQACYREISSCSNFESFQARRMKARWHNQAMGRPELLHTLNGSGLAVGRTLVAIMENYQEQDGGIRIPDVLHPYMGNMTRIAPVDGRG